MRYSDLLTKTQFSKEDLLAMSRGLTVDSGFDGEIARLPAPPFLMFDSINYLERKGRRGSIVAEQNIHMDAWYFQCHFRDDPVQPGCLGVDAIWQLLGFYAAACGSQGSGRALGCKEIDFFGQIRPFDHKVRYEVGVKRLSSFKEKGVCVVIGDGEVYVDDCLIYTVKDARVGMFKEIAYRNYPCASSPHARGGVLQRQR